jgi:hypothetical protein
MILVDLRGHITIGFLYFISGDDVVAVVVDFIGLVCAI